MNLLIILHTHRHTLRKWIIGGNKLTFYTRIFSKRTEARNGNNIKKFHVYMTIIRHTQRKYFSPTTLLVTNNVQTLLFSILVFSLEISDIWNQFSIPGQNNVYKNGWKYNLFPHFASYCFFFFYISFQNFSNCICFESRCREKNE